MREIKFRAWVLKDEALDGLMENMMEYDVESFHDPLYEYKRGNIILMQYTGLKDKNGKEIYEGDIIRNDRGTILKVPFVDGAFYAEGTDALSKQYVFSVLSDFSSWSEVIGNIYENSELLEASK
ncbi:YopX family protein [Bacillus sp. FSL R12-0069]|uniref:YopX family protein n=1 Tax=Bacillus sp. FSL R12-0069 TaxID=2975342 RepID=UPI0030FB6FBC